MLEDAVQANGHKDGAFGHPFLVVMWTLCCRASSMTFIHLSHLEMRNDAMAVFFTHTKTDQVRDSEVARLSCLGF